MDAATTSQSGLELSRASSLLSDEQRRALNALPASVRDNPIELVATIRRNGWLTPYQLDEIAAGRVEGLTIGPYLILDRIGEGGMGQVFRARHRELNRITALKVIRPDKYSTTTRERFKREARAAAALKHPNVVGIYDCGEVDGTAFAAMEWIDGVDLNRFFRKTGPLRIGTACDFVRQAALGLQHAHENGLIHRDIKPSNLIATDASPPVVKILDFGLARIERQSDADLTGPDQIMGTLPFIAPEQAERIKSADIRSDIFSLGCTLYFLLTGRVPYDGEGLELLTARLRGQAIPLRRVFPAAPPALEAVLAKMLARQPAMRFQTPAEVANALQPFLEDSTALPAVVRSDAETVDQRAPTTATRMPQTWRRRVTASVVAVGIIAALVLGGIAYINRDRGHSVTPPPSGAEFEVLPMPREALAAPPEPRDALGIVLGDANFRCFRPIRRIAISPDGRRVAAYNSLRSDDGERGSLDLFDGTTGRRIDTWRQIDPNQEITALTFSQDGRFLAGGMRKSAVCVWDMNLAAPFLAPLFKNDQVHVARITQFQGNDLWLMDPASLRRWKLAGGEMTAHSAVPVSSYYPGNSRLSADGSTLVFVQQISLHVKSVVRPGDPLRKVLDATYLANYALAISPDGTRVALGSNPVRVVDITGERAKDLLSEKFDPGDDDANSAVAFSPDGALLAVGRTNGELTLWRMDAAPMKLKSLHGHDNEVTALAFSGDSKMLVSAGSDHRIRLWRVPDLVDAHPTGEENSGLVSAVAFSKDGQAVLTASRGSGPGLPRNRLEVRNATTGAVIRRAVDNWSLTDLAIADDGNVVHFSGRYTPQRRTIGFPFNAYWRWEEQDPAKPNTVTMTGNTVRIAVSDAGGRFAILALAPIAELGSRVEIRNYRTPSLFGPVFSVKGAIDVAISPDGKRIAFACESGANRFRKSAILVYDIAAFDGRNTRNMNDPLPNPILELTDLPPISRLLFGDDSEALIYADSLGKIVRRKGKTVDEFSMPELRQATCLAKSATGAFVAAATEEGDVVVWSKDLWDVASVQWKLPGPVYSIAFDRETKRIAAGLGNGTAVILTLP